LVEVKTKYTLKLYRDFYWFALFRGKHYRFGKAMFPVATAVMIGMMIWSFTSAGADSFTQIMTTCMSALCILFYIMAFIRPKSYVKRAPVLFETGLEFVFNEDSYVVAQAGELINGTATTRYEALHKVYETKTVFYLYLTPVQALLINKDDIIKGTPEALRNILRVRIPAKKYIICK